jgi:hypothetical protein
MSENMKSAICEKLEGVLVMPNGVSKGYVSGKRFGPHNVCLNPNQEKPELTFDDKDTILCSGSCRSSADKFSRFQRVNEGNQYGEFDKVSPVDPNKGKPLFAKPRKNSPFKRAKSTPVVIRK